MSLEGTGWRPTGHVVDVAPQVDRIPPYNPRAGEHLWLILTSYRVNPAVWAPDHSVHLDPENLLSIAGPLCYYCEQPYEPRLARRRCKGDP